VRSISHKPARSEISLLQSTIRFLAYLCTPEHSKQNTFPKLTEAHCGFFIPQSQHTWFPGRALTTSWSFALI
jgi:hypothetical protein